MRPQHWRSDKGLKTCLTAGEAKKRAMQLNSSETSISQK